MYRKQKLLTIKFSYLFLIVCLVSCTKKDEEVIPFAPNNLTAIATIKGEINLSWTDNSTNEIGFKIERKTENGSFQNIAHTIKDITSFKDSLLSPNTTFYYRIYSYNNAGKSLTYTNIAEFQTLPSFTIGESFGGGIIFYLDNSGEHGLIAATQDIATTFWYHLDNIQTGATDIAVGSGKANTLKIINKHGTMIMLLTYVRLQK